MAGNRSLASAALIAAALAAPATAGASPFEDSSLGGAVFTGPTAPHASSIYVNPAALGLAVPGWHLFAGGSLRLDQLSVDRKLVDLDSGAVTDGPSVSTTTASPGGMLAAYWRSQTAAIGLATFTPMAERFPTNASELRYHTLGGHHYQWTVLSLSVAFRWNKFWLGIGAGLGNMNSLRLRFARDTALEAGSAGVDADCGGAPCGVENPAASQRYRVDVATGGLRPLDLGFFGSLFSTENLSVNAGAAYSPREGWLVALSYQGSVGLLGSGRRLQGDVRVQGSELEGGIVRRGEAEIGYDLPETFNLGLRAPLPGAPELELVGGVRWQTWFTHDQLDVRMFGGDLAGHDIPEQYPLYRGFRNAFRFDVGVERKSFYPFRYGGRLSLERGAVLPDELTPLSTDSTNLAAGVGIEWRLGAALVLGFGYTLAWYLPASAPVDLFDPRDRIACVDSGFRLDECEAVREGRARPTAAGDYNRLRHNISASVRWDFL
jgi:long-subunit fatty acid transport protein